MHRATLAAIALYTVAACGGGDGGHDGPHDHPERITEFGLFADAPAQVPADGVVPYEVIAPLFSDYAAKHRFISVPAGRTITYDDTGKWVFPVGTILVKTFAYLADLRDPASEERLIETRLLIHREDGWTAHTFIWNDEQTEAVHEVAGAIVPVTWIDRDGAMQSLDYRVPNVNQCRSCHAGGGPLEPLGPRTRQLDRELDYGAGPVNQIDHLMSLGLLDRAPPPAAERIRLVDPFGAAEPEPRARAYFDSNCAHCHRDGGSASASGLWLGFEITDPVALGICRHPAAAGSGTGGRRFDVVPAAPDESIMIYRMESTDPDIKMPEVSLLSDSDGVAVVRAWIASLPPMSCD